MKTAIDAELNQGMGIAHFVFPFANFKELNGRRNRGSTEKKGIYVWKSEGKSGISDTHLPSDFPIPNITHIKPPYYFQNKNSGEFGICTAGWFEAEILEIGANKVAALGTEPLKGACWEIVSSESCWVETKCIVGNFGILPIGDEMICALSRPGCRLAYVNFGHKPDFVTFTKPIASTYISLSEVLRFAIA